MSKRVTIDPITRIEGHLRIDVDVDGGRVKKAWSSGQMWRGVELILLGRDPRDAWAITQRICGVCTTVHAITSVRAVENALNMEVPLNAQYIRNLIILAHAVHDQIVHFYHLSALDWVDVTSALKADPDKAAALGESLSSWSLNNKHEMRKTHERLKHFVNGGQLGIFTNGYWGHPAMKLSPEVNLMAVAHYLQALEVQRKANKIVSILGAKTPHIQNVAVGGVANPIATDSQSVLTVERLMAIKGFIDELSDFVKNVYLIDVAAVGAFYADWTAIGKGVTNYLAVPDIPMDTKGTQFAMPGGFIEGGNLSKLQADHQTFGDEYFTKGVEESVKHSWYDYSKREEARCIPTRARPSPTTPTSRTTPSIPGSSRRPSTVRWPRSAPWRACWQHARRGPRADQEIRHRRARHRLGAGQDQGRSGCHALDHRPPRRARRDGRGAGRHARPGSGPRWSRISARATPRPSTRR
jgi:hydrogenase large subunit